MALLTGEEVRAKYGVNPDRYPSINGKYDESLFDKGSTFSTSLNSALQNVAQYVNDLESEARGDFDFITKFLDKQHAIALGNDDEERAKFFESVSNELEKRVGRIPFDFQQRTQREKEDISYLLNKQRLEREDLLAQEKEFETSQQVRERREKKKIAENANARGLLNSGIEKSNQSEASINRTLEASPERRRIALAKLLNSITSERSILESGRRLEDITTDARRDSQDTEFGIEQRSEEAQRNLDRRLADIKREGALEEARIRALKQQEEELRLSNA